MEIIDADGHVNDAAGQGGDRQAYASWQPVPRRYFPSSITSIFIICARKETGRGLENPGPDEWIQFLNETGISWSVLYPTFGLAVGRFVSVHWAIAACRAYNNWLHESSSAGTPG